MPNFRKGAEGMDPTPDVIIGPRFRAKYDGSCTDCGFDIDEGEMSRMVEDPATTPADIFHSSCAEDYASELTKIGKRVQWGSVR